ncbi:MAG: hypothetical protein SGI97_11110 [candidate division Zixibacteria bacterium]|nr:hypothetical protein [candidate division Zixibacteria bacterium]
MATYNWRRLYRQLRSDLSYTMSELATALNTSPRTIQRWKKEGMKPVSATDWPLLIMGSEAKRFLNCRIRNKRVSLKPDEFYCVKCRAARTALHGTIDHIYTGKTFGNGEECIWRIAKCCICGQELARFGSRFSFFGQFEGVTHTPHNEGLVETSDHPSNVIIRKDVNHEAEL